MTVQSTAAVSHIPAQSQRRKTLRLREYDYTTPGAYFVTICVNNKKPILGKIAGEEIILAKADEIVWEVWHNLPGYYSTIELDEFIVMPNHVHGIIWILGSSPPDAVGAFKSFSAREVNKNLRLVEKFSWQRSYHEHIVRNDDDLNQHRVYIQNNPLKWSLGEYYR